ncbi:MAG: IMP dehydrogenase [Gammaproteobacteria bacterium]|nr:IMP dehydrogenase [Gammaproteobacteria bacterium]MYF37824.1 IMP dehydrogenase [Gammaproteobacteria bacterium]
MVTVTEEAYTFDDVLLRPAYSEVLPTETSTHTQLSREIRLNIPLISSAMDTVTESRLGIALAQEGGIGIVHKNMSIEAQAQHVRQIKKFEAGIIRDPITISPKATIQELLSLTKTNNISGVPVVNENELVGIVTHRDIRFQENLNALVSEVMTPKDRLITADESATFSVITQLLHEHRIEKILLVDDQYRLTGMVTVKDIEKAKTYPNACKDGQGRLRAGASVGTSVDTDERVSALVDAEVDVLVVDTAHGHSRGVLDRIRWIKQSFPQIQVVGGNVATAEGAQEIIEAGVDAVKVGIGPGSICTTRIVSGVGVPQVSAISDVSKVAKSEEVPVIADGGIRFSGDIAKAIAAGASGVMIGSLFAGTDESPGEVELFQGRTYKNYRGMGSVGAMQDRHGSRDRYFQDDTKEIGKLVPEGVEGRVPYRGPIGPIIGQLVGGLRSAMGYTGCRTIEEMQQKVTFTKVTQASIVEGHVHDVTITKESPNYPGTY